MNLKSIHRSRSLLKIIKFKSPMQIHVLHTEIYLEWHRCLLLHVKCNLTPPALMICRSQSSKHQILPWTPWRTCWLMSGDRKASPRTLQSAKLWWSTKGTTGGEGKATRALCLLPHACKVLSLCLLRIIMSHAETILPDTQAGFRPSRRCRDNVCIHVWTVECSKITTLFSYPKLISRRPRYFWATSTSLTPWESFQCLEKHIRLVKVMYYRAAVALRLKLEEEKRLTL